MTCRCGNALSEDLQFAADMALYSCAQRRYVCAAGHSLTTAVPAPETIQRPQTMHAPARKIDHICEWCAAFFIGITRQKYCSDACARAVDAERTAQRNTRDPSRFSSAALRRMRSLPPLSRRAKALAPYADRPRGLSMRWA